MGFQPPIAPLPTYQIWPLGYDDLPTISYYMYNKWLQTIVGTYKP